MSVAATPWGDGVVPVPDLDTVHDAIVWGLDGAKFSNGDTLSVASDTSSSQCPCLSLQTGAFTTQEWDNFTTKVIWDIPGQLKTTGDAGRPGAAIRRTISDLLAAMNLIRGLPVDDLGRFVPYGPEAVQLSFKGKLNFLAMHGGPVIRSVRVYPETKTDPFSVADVLMHVEFLIHQPPEEVKRKVSLVSMGINVFDANRTALAWDPKTQPYTIPAPALSDTYAQSGFVAPDTTLTINGRIVKASDPPIPADLPDVSGEDPSKTVQALRVEPIVKTLTVPNTFQLLAIATYADGSVAEVHLGTQWSSGTPGVATVGSTGLLTAVSSGTSTITATYNGVSGTCAVTVS